jgi:hypothetical protein
MHSFTYDTDDCLSFLTNSNQAKKSRKEREQGRGRQGERLSLCFAAGASACIPLFCSPGFAQAGCSSILVVYAFPWSFNGEYVRTTILGTGNFATVDTFNAYYDTPTASQLAAYHAVLVYSWDSFSDATLLGDRLADFHDQGGGVVVAYAANSGNDGGHILRGAYGAADNGYALLHYASGGNLDSPDSLGDVLEPQSPLLTGVASLTASNAFRSSAPVISGQGIVVARWSGGLPLVVRGMRGNSTLVELNFWPASSGLYSNSWSGDGAALMRNALKYSRCMLCGPGTFSATGEA